ncbi:hypothetical protein PR048_007142 [Dryococelus australis]|uniref:Uncharacterized protein n=1 Tax=Dryococelus australis TaxID=614101 RepID=A0ABQ9IEZ4_9NEOP|nr:hypothetical protein PR048_007142 [Dryococelus australis]
MLNTKDRKVCTHRFEEAELEHVEVNIEASTWAIARTIGVGHTAELYTLCEQLPHSHSLRQAQTPLPADFVKQPKFRNWT